MAVTLDSQLSSHTSRFWLDYTMWILNYFEIQVGLISVSLLSGLCREDILNFGRNFHQITRYKIQTFIQSNSRSQSNQPIIQFKSIYQSIETVVQTSASPYSFTVFFLKKPLWPQSYIHFWYCEVLSAKKCVKLCKICPVQYVSIIDMMECHNWCAQLS